MDGLTLRPRDEQIAEANKLAEGLAERALDCLDLPRDLLQDSEQDLKRMIHQLLVTHPPRD